jgi:sulfatase modifying factor 1
MRPWLLLGIGLLLLQGCSESVNERYSLVITFPVPEADSKAQTNTLRVYLLRFVGDGASCQSLQDGITQPKDSMYKIEEVMSIYSPFPDPLVSIKANMDTTGTRVFFVQGEDANGIVIFNGCIGVQPEGDGSQVAVILNHTYTVTFDGDGATVEANPTTKTATVPATTVDTLPTEPTKTDYIFGGWYTENNGGGTEFTTSSVVTASMTVYAKWTETDPMFCSRHNKNCDSFTGEDNLGQERTANCGQCAAPDACGDGGTANVCGHQTSPNIGILVFVPGGTFQRDDDANNISEVSAFHMSQTEITQDQYYAITGSKPSSFSDVIGGPVERVSWYDAVEFCNKLSLVDRLTPVYTITNRVPAYGYPIDSATVTMNKDNNGYRLPTEMEWMWAAMGATRGSGYTSGTYMVGYEKEFAGDPHPTIAGDSIGDYAWITSNSGNTTHTVGTTKYPNELGLYDMSGNVYEWCWDWKDTYQAGLLKDYEGPDVPDSSGARIMRGSDRIEPNLIYASVAGRTHAAPNNASPSYGFRVVRR